MRFMTWNCQVGGFRRKAALVAPFRPDVLVIAEMERLDGALLLDGDVQPTFAHRWCIPGARRGLGVLSYTGASIEPLDVEDDAAFGFHRMLVSRPEGILQVVAVWTSATSERSTTYRQAHEGLVRHAAWIRQRPTIMLGDFNNNATYEKGRPWADLAALCESLGLVSAYHQFSGEEPGRESQATYFHHRKVTSPWHVDYCFVPSTSVSSLNVSVGRPEEWLGHSDHVALVVDIDL